MDHGLLKDFFLIFGFSALSVFLLSRIKVPSIVGFIVAGLLIGPNGLSFITDVHEIEALAEIGVILLLFTIGLEFSLRQLIRIRNVIIFSGGGQVALTIIFTTLVSYFIVNNIKTALFMGFLVSLSSTAIVLKSISERGEIDSPQGKMMMGVLIFQDLIVVPMMILTPALSGSALNLPPVALLLTKGAAVVFAVIALAKWIVPTILHQVVRTRSRELFLLTVIMICLGIAIATAELGLSLALGAFLAGLIISESEYAHQATSDILPFKDSFLGIFFVSIGMLIDTSFIAANWMNVLGSVFIIYLTKIVAGSVSLLSTSTFAPRASILAALGIAQIGEFSFVLADAGKSLGIMDDGLFQLFLSASVITMVLTPFVHNLAPAISYRIISLGIFKEHEADAIETDEGLKDHVIIIGFGLNGRNLAYTLRQSGLRYLILEMNNQTVMEEKKKGEPIHFGEGTSVEILKKLNINTARAVVVAISDPASTRKIVSAVRHLCPKVHIIVRTRYVAEVDELSSLGANDVIPEEFETSVELFARVLNHYNIPKNVIKDHIEGIRQNAYEALRSHELFHKTMVDRPEIMGALHTDTFLIKDRSPLIGRTVRDIELRSESGATLIAIERIGNVIENPSPDMRFETGDILLLVGKKTEIHSAHEYLEKGSFNFPLDKDPEHFNIP